MDAGEHTASNGNNLQRDVRSDAVGPQPPADALGGSRWLNRSAPRRVGSAARCGEDGKKNLQKPKAQKPPHISLITIIRQFAETITRRTAR